LATVILVLQPVGAGIKWLDVGKEDELKWELRKEGHEMPSL